MKVNLKFEKGYYGPYSHQLQHMMKYLNGGAVLSLNMNNIARYNSKIEESKACRRLCWKNLSNSQKERLANLKNLIEGFESPYGLELLATIDYIEQNKNISSLTGSGKCNRTMDKPKRNLMKPYHIKVAHLRVNDFLYKYKSYNHVIMIASRFNRISLLSLKLLLNYETKSEITLRKDLQDHALLWFWSQKAYALWYQKQWFYSDPKKLKQQMGEDKTFAMGPLYPVLTDKKDEWRHNEGCLFSSGPLCGAAIHEANPQKHLDIEREPTGFRAWPPSARLSWSTYARYTARQAPGKPTRCSCRPTW